MAKLPNFLVIIRSEKLSGKGQGRGVGVRKKERFVLGKRTFRSQKSKHFVLRIIHSATDIPVHLSPGKYILKSVDPKTGAITVIAKRLNIKDVYMLKAEGNKDCIYWFHRI